MVKCTVLSDLERRGSCMKDSDGSDFLYLPIIIIATVGIIVATVSIGFGPLEPKTCKTEEHENVKRSVS